MPPARKCTHAHLQVDVSSHAADAGFLRPPHAKRQAATTPSGRVSKTTGTADDDEMAHAYTFPGPLVLPDDALSIDPKEPPQSFRSWHQGVHRNPFTSARKTIYLAPVPSISPKLPFMKTWTAPAHTSPDTPPISPPKTADLLSYLTAFYHPLPVALLATTPVAFVPWDTKPSPALIGLQLGAPTITGIRTRPCPDGAFPRQLNLNDLLDAAIEAVPADAYALVLATEHDLYEDDDDDFCCGRAYGGSRVAVVSGARYHPGLDEYAGVERGHMWPEAHCRRWVEGLCGSKKKGKSGTGDNDGVTALSAAVRAAMRTTADGDLYGLWMSRVARTVAHELGHCLGIAHCVYYACVMQGTAGVAEDVRQPPYLCPVCLAKLVYAVREAMPREKEVVTQRYKALMGFCEKWMGVGMFSGYHAWLGKRVEELEGTL